MSKLESQLYPVITTNSTKPHELAEFLEQKLASVLPDIKTAQTEVEQRFRATEELISKASASDEKSVAVKNKLHELNQKLIEITSEYKILSEVLIGYFKNLDEIDKKAEKYNAELERSGYSKELSGIEALFREHETCRDTIIERLRFAQTECDQISERISKQVRRVVCFIFKFLALTL